MLVYSSGADDLHLDINVMTAGGMHLRRLTDYEGGDESPDWQAIPAPPTKRRCGDLSVSGAAAREIRAAGRRLSCAKALALAARWLRSGEPGGGPHRLKGYDGAARLVAFLYQP